MQAVVKYGMIPGDVELREVEEPIPGDNDVIIEVKSAGICGSDIEFWQNRISFPVNLPVTLGHEFSGVIKEVGKNVTDYQPGDRVVSETAAHICGKCEHCRNGEYNLCPTRLGFGNGTNGCFTKYCKAPERILHKLPENVSFDEAALTEPACVAYNAVLVKSHVMPGEPVAVIGPGPIGLFAVQMAKIAGAYPVILLGTDADESRMEFAKTIGADITVNVMKEDPLEVIHKLTNGMGIPLVIDAAGNTPAVKTAMDIVKRNGQITKIAWGAKPLELSLDPLISKAASLQGTFSHTWSMWEAVLQLISGGNLKMKPMISHIYKLEQWLEAFETVDKKVAIKAIIHPGE